MRSYLADAIAAYGLFKGKTYGEVAFLLIAFSQLLAYAVYSDLFGRQIFLILFHLLTLGIYIFLLRFQKAL